MTFTKRPIGESFLCLSLPAASRARSGLACSSDDATLTAATGNPDASIPGSALTEGQFAALDEEEQKKQRRLIRNRLSAALHRQRQRAHTDTLEAQVVELSALVVAYREALAAMDAACTCGAARDAHVLPPILRVAAGPVQVGTLGITGASTEHAEELTDAVHSMVRNSSQVGHAGVGQATAAVKAPGKRPNANNSSCNPVAFGLVGIRVEPSLMSSSSTQASGGGASKRRRTGKAEPLEEVAVSPEDATTNARANGRMNPGMDDGVVVSADAKWRANQRDSSTKGRKSQGNVSGSKRSRAAMASNQADALELLAAESLAHQHDDVPPGSCEVVDDTGADLASMLTAREDTSVAPSPVKLEPMALGAPSPSFLPTLARTGSLDEVPAVPFEGFVSSPEDTGHMMVLSNSLANIRSHGLVPPVPRMPSWNPMGRMPSFPTMLSHQPSFDMLSGVGSVVYQNAGTLTPSLLNAAHESQTEDINVDLDKLIKSQPLP
jgi:hypothetical protein